MGRKELTNHYAQQTNHYAQSTNHSIEGDVSLFSQVNFSVPTMEEMDTLLLFT